MSKQTKIAVLLILALLLCSTASAQGVSVTCPDRDYDSIITNRIMHLEVREGEKLVQKIEYSFGDEFTEVFDHKKHFDMVDLNFDGHDDILILAEFTNGGSQPYYDAFFWNEAEKKFILNPPFWDEIQRTYIKCDTENCLLYALYNTTHGMFIYYIYKFSLGEYKEKGVLFEDYTTEEYSESYDWDMTFDENKAEQKWVSFEDLPLHWKRAISFPGFDF